MELAMVASLQQATVASADRLPKKLLYAHFKGTGPKGGTMTPWTEYVRDESEALGPSYSLYGKAQDRAAGRSAMDRDSAATHLIFKLYTENMQWHLAQCDTASWGRSKAIVPSKDSSNNLTCE